MIQLLLAFWIFNYLYKGLSLDILPRNQPSKTTASKTLQTKPIMKMSGNLNTSRPARRKRILKKKLVRYSLVVFNLAVIASVSYLAFNYTDNQATSYGFSNTMAEETSNPLDSLSAAEVAVNIAKLTGLPQELAVTNQADTIDLYLKAAINEGEFVTKGQILSASIKSKQDIIEHAVSQDETVSILATKYGVTSDSIKWSNGLSQDALEVGAKLSIPPVNGFVYIVGVGDTPEKLAESYSANADAIIAFNDAELGGLKVGDKIVIPNGTKQRIPAFLRYKANYGQNGYWRGYCTWYVASKINVPNNWGNANTWDNFAKVSPGWTVSSAPVVGAIAQSNSGAEGHVAIVEAVSEDGSMIKYSDMNGLAGWGVEGRTAEWVPARRSFQNFIIRVN